MATSLPACIYCNRGCRNTASCPVCSSFFSPKRCCSERCLRNHIRAVHPDAVLAEDLAKEVRDNFRSEQQREQKRLDRLAKVNAESLQLTCTNCEAVFRVPRKSKGKIIACPNCNIQSNVPEAELVSLPGSETDAQPNKKEPTLIESIFGCGCLLAVVFFGFAIWQGYSNKPAPVPTLPEVKNPSTRR